MPKLKPEKRYFDFDPLCDPVPHQLSEIQQAIQGYLVAAVAICRGDEATLRRFFNDIRATVNDMEHIHASRRVKGQ